MSLTVQLMTEIISLGLVTITGASIAFLITATTTWTDVVDDKIDVSGENSADQ